MKIAIFSDVHANLQALEAFEAAAKEAGADEYLCLGDVVGYGGNPKECLEIVKRLTDFRPHVQPIQLMIQGNHDEAVGLGIDPTNFNGSARDVVANHIKVLGEDERLFLRNLSSEFVISDVFGSILFVHGSPKEKFEYIMNEHEAIQDIAHLIRMGHALCFVGHTHNKPRGYICRQAKYLNGMSTPGYYESDAFLVSLVQRLEISPAMESEFIIDEGDVGIINVGSVGQPRDRDNRGGFAIYDDSNRSVKFIRFEYDIAGAQKAILRLGNPKGLAIRLAVGI